MNMKMRRTFAMPSAETFQIAPIGAFVKSYIVKSGVSIDPFAGNSKLATYTNDLNPGTSATMHLDAAEYLVHLQKRGIVADLLIFDPPYSPRQIAECYKGIGREVTMEDTQSAAMYRRVKLEIGPVLARDGIVLSFGWNSCSPGSPGASFDLMEILMVCHGGAHNDTICTAWKRSTGANSLELF